MSPRNLLAAGCATSPQLLAKPASARLSGEGFPAGTAPIQDRALSAESVAAEPPWQGNELGLLRATAPKRSLACETKQASRWPSINAGSRSGSSRFPTLAARHACACTAPSSSGQAVAPADSPLCSMRLRHLKIPLDSFWAQESRQFRARPKLPNGQLLLAAFTEQPGYL